MLTTEKDKAFMIQFARAIELLQDVTSSRPKLQAALKEIETPPPADGSYVSGDSGSTAINGQSKGKVTATATERRAMERHGNGNGNRGDAAPAPRSTTPSSSPPMS